MAALPRAHRRFRVSRAAALRMGGALAAGGLTWTAFPPLDWWVAAPLGVAALLLVVRGRTPRAGAGLGFAYGLGLMIPLLNFLRGFGIDAWLVVAALEAVWFALLGLATAVLSRRPWWLLAVPPVWVAVEFVRDRWPFGGFPWGRLAFTQAGGPLLPLAPRGGAVLVGFAVVALSAALAAAVAAGVARPPGRRTALTWGLTALAVVAGLAFGAAAAVRVPAAGTTAGGPAHVVVAAVQGNVPRLGLEAFAQRRAVTLDHVDETLRLAQLVAAGEARRPALVVWPENASDQDPFVDPIARGMIQQAVAAVGVPVVVGAVLDGPGPRHVQNAAVVWTPAGPGERYVKRHLVPFGEYLPMRSVLTRLVGRFSLIAKDFSPGSRPGVLDAGGVRFGDVICYEVADDGVVRDAVVGGGRLLVVQTNNASYEHPGDDGRGGETAQQLAMARLRAVEHGRAVVVAATSGVSAVISPTGSVEARSRVFTPAVLVADVPLRDPRTVSDRLGAWPERVLTALGALALGAAALPRRRRPPAPLPTPVAAPPLLVGPS